MTDLAELLKTSWSRLLIFLLVVLGLAAPGMVVLAVWTPLFVAEPVSKLLLLALGITFPFVASNTLLGSYRWWRLHKDRAEPSKSTSTDSRPPTSNAEVTSCGQRDLARARRCSAVALRQHAVSVKPAYHDW